MSDSVKAKCLLIALVVVIVGGVGLTVRAMMDDPSKAKPAGDDPPGYLCDQCDKHFTLTREQYAQQIPDAKITETDPMAARRPHCPLCQAKHSGWTMVRCPKCGKTYVPPGQGQPGPVRAGEPEDVCHHDKTDRGE